MSGYHNYFTGFEMTPDPWPAFVEAASTPAEPSIKIRVTFNRDLTNSERESFREHFDKLNVNDDYGVSYKFTKPSTVVLEGDDSWESSAYNSRSLYEEVATFVEKRLVNVHPIAARTFIPEVVV